MNEDPQRLDGVDDSTAPVPAAAYRETGQVCYETYGSARGWTYPGGTRMRRWADLDERDRDHWRAAAHEVIQRGWRQAQPAPASGRQHHDR